MEEKDLVAKLKNPDTRNYGFNLLVREYQKRLYALVRKMVIDHDDSDDLLQEIFIKVYRNIDKFREDSSLYTWLYRIASNECLSFLANKRKRFFLPIHDLGKELSVKFDSSPQISGDEIQLKLQKSILKLPDKQRLVFNMRYYEDLSYEEMADITQTSVGALKASYHLAVKKIEETIISD